MLFKMTLTFRSRIIFLTIFLLLLFLYYNSTSPESSRINIQNYNGQLTQLMNFGKRLVDYAEDEEMGKHIKKVTDEKDTMYPKHVTNVSISQRNEIDRVKEILTTCSNNSVAALLSNTSIYKNNVNETLFFARKFCSTEALPTCTKTFVGPLRVETEEIKLSTLYDNELYYVQYGGWWAPKGCREVHSTAIVIPFRNRQHQLPVLLRQLFPILMRQRLHSRIFVIEQDDESSFNRGKLLNVGYAEALKMFPYSCFVFHDVDLIPEDDRISYGCKHSPMHMSVAVDKFHYQLPYSEIFGGVEMFRRDDYRKVDGFPNIFYSWGGEDDVLSWRVKYKYGMKLHRQSIQIARYTMLKHKDVGVNRKPEEYTQTKLLMRTAKSNKYSDGVHSLQYKVKEIVLHQLYTLIKVDLQKEKEKDFGIKL